MKKYILYWGDGDGCTYHSYFSQPFKTDDVDKWEYELISEIEKRFIRSENLVKNLIYTLIK